MAASAAPSTPVTPVTPMNTFETDHLVIGSGTTGLAFVDTLIDETDAHVSLIDRHGKPGSHWNDAHSFVTLHQSSAIYGVNSMALGSGRTDSIGHNDGAHPDAIRWVVPCDSWLVNHITTPPGAEFFPHTLHDYPRVMSAPMWNHAQWGQVNALGQWICNSRLDGFGKLMAGIDPQDADKQAIIARLTQQAMSGNGQFAEAAVSHAPKRIGLL